MFNINFREHPSRQNLYVFYFRTIKEADYFEELLTERNISFEKEPNIEEGIEVWYYGIDKPDFEHARTANYLVSAKFRKPFIADSGLRYLVLGITLLAILLALAGYLIS